MNVLKKSFFPIALSSIVLLASITPAFGAQRAPRRKAATSRPVKPVSQQGVTPVVHVPEAPKPAEVLKRKLTWKQKFCKKVRELKKDFFELVGDHPVATVATVLGSALVLWLAWDKLSNPWIHREGVIGQSACDILEVVVPQGNEREIVHHIFERPAVLDPVALAQGVRHFIDGEVQHHIIQNRFRLANPAQIVQLRSADQAPGGSCAYHATKNCMVILNEIANPQGTLENQLQGNDLCNQLFGQEGEWRRRILAGPYLRNGDCFRNGDWLGGNAVQNIVDHERRVRIAPANDPANRGLLADFNTPITVIEDANRINHPDPVINATQAVRIELANAIQANLPYTHGFIFNTARTENGRVPARDNGHWLAAVLHRNAQGEIKWYCANSTNWSLLHNGVLRDLIAAVQGAAVQ